MNKCGVNSWSRKKVGVEEGPTVNGLDIRIDWKNIIFAKSNFIQFHSESGIVTEL